MVESIEVAGQTFQLKTEQMQEKIDSRNVLIEELENVIQELTEQLKAEASKV